MRNLWVVVLLLIASGLAHSGCPGDPLTAFRAYEVALSQMKAHDDQSIIPYLTSSAAATFNEMAQRRRKTVEMLQTRGDPVDRAAQMLSIQKNTRGSYFEGVKLEAPPNDTEAILSSKSVGPETEKVDEDGVKEVTHSERVTTVTMRCEGGWKLQEEKTIGLLLSVKTNKSGRVVGKSQQGDGFGYIFP